MLATVIALVGLRALNLWLDRVGSRPAEDAAEGVPDPAEAEPPPRSAMYVAIVTAARAAGLALALLVILQAWGLDVAGWLAGDTGRSALATASRIAVIGLVVLACGEADPDRAPRATSAPPTPMATCSTTTARARWSA